MCFFGANLHEGNVKGIGVALTRLDSPKYLSHPALYPTNVRRVAATPHDSIELGSSRVGVGGERWQGHSGA